MYKKQFCIIFLLSVFQLSGSCDHSYNLAELRQVNFDVAMSAEQNYYNRQQHWNYARNIYNQHIINNPQYSSIPKIPKIIHQIWLGSPFPEAYKTLQETWLRNHPDWKYILWTDKDVEELGLYNKALYDRARNYGEKSDIARYEILYRFGGLYVDTDFECLKPFDILNHLCDFYTGIAYMMSGGIYNGLIASKPNHQFLRYCIESMAQLAHNGETANDIVYRTGPNFFTGRFYDYMHACPGINIAFPVSFFYPWPNYARHDKRRESILSWVKPESFAIHHWYTSWWKE